MDDWEEAEPVIPVLKKDLPKNPWADEDADENDVKESWEDEDEEPASAPAPAPAPAETSTKKAAKKFSSLEKGKSVEVAKPDEVLDPLAEKLHQQRLVEEADFKATTELFGKRADGKSLDTFIPKSESDFAEYAELISSQLRPYDKSYHYIGLLKSLMRLSMASLKAAEVKEVGSSVMAIANEKLKAEKEATAGKKKTATKKKQLHVTNSKDDDIALAYGADVADDYDFM
ncbi:hypothetical protein MKW92_024623 [Papaver armeniacum]|nr:hypothetical protein MKW92_024623 [Papaver armeniacum]